MKTLAWRPLSRENCVEKEYHYDHIPLFTIIKPRARNILHPDKIMDITNIEIDTLRITYLYSLYFLFEQKDLSVDLLLGLALNKVIIITLHHPHHQLIPE